MNKTLNKSIAILILAAGESKRFGSPKQLASYRGKQLLTTAIESARGTNQAVFVVVGAAREKLFDLCESIEIITNLNWRNGIASSINRGLQFTQPFDATLITLADLPLISTHSLNKLIEAYRKQSNKIIASRYCDTVGTPAIFPREYYLALRKLEGDRGAKFLIKKNLNETILIDMNEAAFDVDRRSDLSTYKN